MEIIPYPNIRFTLLHIKSIFGLCHHYGQSLDFLNWILMEKGIVLLCGIFEGILSGYLLKITDLSIWLSILHLISTYQAIEVTVNHDWRAASEVYILFPPIRNLVKKKHMSHTLPTNHKPCTVKPVWFNFLLSISNLTVVQDCACKYFSALCPASQLFWPVRPICLNTANYTVQR